MRLVKIGECAPLVDKIVVVPFLMFILAQESVWVKECKRSATMHERRAPVDMYARGSIVCDF